MGLRNKQLVLPEASIQAAYKQLVEEIDKLITEKIEHRFGAELRCVPRCSECCIRFSVLPLEAAFILAALSGGAGVQNREKERCVLLDDDLCSVYTARPLICRTQGLPIGYIDEEEEAIQVSACRLNFAEGCAFSYDDLLLMDQFNNILAELNGRYCRDVGLDPAQRINIAELVE